MRRRSSQFHLMAMTLTAVILLGCRRDVGEPPTNGSAKRAVAAMPATPSKAAEANLGKMTWMDGHRQYQIRPPAGYRASTRSTADGGKTFRWAGKNYRVTSTLETFPCLDVTIETVPAGETTAQQELMRKLKSLSETKSVWQQSEVTSRTLNGMPFLHCTFEFEDRFGAGRGFLYFGMDDNRVIHMHSTGYGTPGEAHLEITSASAMTIRKRAEPSLPSVDRWKTFEPLPDEPIEFQSPPLAPEPVPNEAEIVQLAEEDKLVAQAMDEARSAELGVFVRFEPMPDGSIKALINAGATPDGLTNWTLEQRLTFGNGIPLLPIQASWQVERQVEQGQSAPQLTAQDTHYRLHKIDAFRKTGPVAHQAEDVAGHYRVATDSFRRTVTHGRQRRLLWSPHGNTAFALTSEGHLIKIDANTWKLVAAVRPKSRIRDIAWSSQGLIALQKLSDSSHNAKPWAMIEPHPDQTSAFESHRLFVIDPATLEIRRAYRLEGSAVVGHSDRDLVYVQQRKRSRLLVVNVATGELVNMVHSDSLVSEKAVDSEGATSPSSHPCLDSADLRLIRDGREMLSIDRRFGLHRLSLTGPRISCRAYGKPAGSTKVTEDGQFLVFPRRMGRDTWLNFIRTQDFDETAGSVRCPMSPSVFAVDSVSKTIVYPLSSSQYLPEPRETKLRILQDEIDIAVPLGKETVLDMHTHPQGHGVLVFAETGAYWLSFTPRGKRWCFERSSSNVLPAVACDIRPVRPEKPLEARESRDKNRLELPVYAVWIGWAADGSAYYVLEQRRFLMHRFDAATNRETHRLDIPNKHSIVPRAFMTKDGILFDHKSVRKVFWLDPDTLQPIWELDSEYAYWPVGHRNHGFVAARHNGGLIVFEAKTARVRCRASLFDIGKQWPDPCSDRVAFVFSDPDPDIVKCYRDRLVTFGLDGGRIEYLKSGGRNHGTMPKFETPEPQYEPKGFTYRIRERKTTMVVADPDGKDVYWSKRPMRISQIAPHPENPNRVLIAAEGKVHIMTLDLKLP
jgi:hypothetical protein